MLWDEDPEKAVPAVAATLLDVILETFTLDTFSPLIGTTFKVEVDGAPPFDMALESAFHRIQTTLSECGDRMLH